MTDEDLRYIKDKHLADVLEDLMSALVRDKPTDVVLAIRAWTDRKGMAAVSKGNALGFGLNVEGGGKPGQLAPVMISSTRSPSNAGFPKFSAPAQCAKDDDNYEEDLVPPSPKGDVRKASLMGLAGVKGGFASAPKVKKPGHLEDDVTALME